MKRITNMLKLLFPGFSPSPTSVRGGINLPNALLGKGIHWSLQSLKLDLTARDTWTLSALGKGLPFPGHFGAKLASGVPRSSFLLVLGCAPLLLEAMFTNP